MRFQWESNIYIFLLLKAGVIVGPQPSSLPTHSMLAFLHQQAIACSMHGDAARTLFRLYPVCTRPDLKAFPLELQGVVPAAMVPSARRKWSLHHVDPIHQHFRAASTA